MIRVKQQSGFTIVELLIVIVVIAILAVISIVAYNGIQAKANSSTAQAALSQANKKLGEYLVLNNSYPTDLASFKTSLGGGASATDYQYSVNNGVSPATYCVTATSGTVSYKSDSVATQPTAGACAGHGSGGVPPITNLVVNPSLETSGNGWIVSNGANITGARVQVSGKWLYQGTRLTAVAVALRASANLPSTVVSGNTYTGSAIITSSVTQSLRIDVRQQVSNATIYSDTYTVTAGVPQRLTTTGIVNDTSVFVALYSASGTIGDVITMDEAMLTSGSTIYSYFDGNSPNWAWSGTVNESPSYGPGS
jgi:prepilin-type N-terminal cleavage/methylation domain-containing protein